MKFGFDLHGVVDERPEMFAAMAKALIDAGHEVHMITGKRNDEDLVRELAELEFPYTHIFSITSYHEEIGTEMTYDENKHPFMDAYKWDRTKGDYARRVNLDILFDDSDSYDYAFSTPYARFYTRDKKKRYGRG